MRRTRLATRRKIVADEENGNDGQDGRDGRDGQDPHARQDGLEGQEGQDRREADAEITTAPLGNASNPQAALSIPTST